MRSIAFVELMFIESLHKASDLISHQGALGTLGYLNIE